MTRKDIHIVRMQSATIIESSLRFISYDHKAGAEEKDIQCIVSFWPPESFIKDLVNSKIIHIKVSFGHRKMTVRESSVFLFVFTPQFGYTNQKLEDIFCELFEKYNL